jgi:hypothetical protein
LIALNKKKKKNRIIDCKQAKDETMRNIKERALIKTMFGNLVYSVFSKTLCVRKKESLIAYRQKMK